MDMMKEKINVRDITLKELGLTHNRMKELEYFCLQYDNWKNELKDINFYVTGKNITQDLAIKISTLKSKINLIERCANAVDELDSKYIILNVCYQVSYQHLGVLCGRRQFYEKRRLFFHYLDKEREL